MEKDKVYSADLKGAYVFRASPLMCKIGAIFTAVFDLMILSAVLAGYIRSGHDVNLTGIGLLLFIPVLAYFYFTVFRIIIRDGKLTYITLFSGVHSLALSDIRTARYRTETRQRPRRYEVVTFGREHETSMILNLSMISGPDAKMLEEILHTAQQNNRLARGMKR